MSTSSLTIPDPGGDVVFSGVDDDNPLGMVSMNRIGKVARPVYADPSQFLDGDLEIRSTWAEANINALVRLDGTSQADLEAKCDRVVTVIARSRYEVIQEFNGVERTYAAHRASLTPADDATVELWDLDAFSALYVLSIPVHPIPVGA